MTEKQGLECRLRRSLSFRSRHLAFAQACPHSRPASAKLAQSFSTGLAFQGWEFGAAVEAIADRWLKRGLA